jgi:hypothetical protein
MPFNGSGTFAIINTFVPNTTILSSATNANNTDIAAGLSDCMTRDGQAGATADLSMGSHKLTNVTDPASAQDAATKNYVDTQNASVWSTGDVKLTFKQVADSGWVLFTDGTIGDATSGATVAAATTSALFTLLYNSPFTDSSCPIFTSTGTPTTRAGQGTAAAAYAAHCRLSTPAALGRAMALAGTGSGLTARILGTTTGAESVTLDPRQIPTIVSANGAQAISVTPTLNVPTTAGSISSSLGAVSGGTPTFPLSTGTWSTVSTITGTNSITATYNPSGGQISTSLMQPTTFLNAMVKL